MTKEIRKRDGSVVPFDRAKIITAISKAFSAEGVTVGEEAFGQMADRVISKIEPLLVPNDVPTVEKLQDLVEETLMERGYFKVAKAYILYRFEHTKERVEEVLEQIDENRLTIEKRDGERELFSREKVKASLQFFIRGYETVVE
jgi:ribonucleoside-diphosphate reductase alpha chain